MTAHVCQAVILLTDKPWVPNNRILDLASICGEFLYFSLVSTCLATNKLVLNISKTNYIMFTSKGKSYNKNVSNAGNIIT